jgi:plasmid stabilization system protein ParE
MTYQVLVTEPADQDRDTCYRFIAQRSPDGGRSWLQAYEDAIDSLKFHPRRGLAPESSDHEEDILQCLFKTRYGLMYRLLYLMRGETVYILHVRGPGQDLHVRGPGQELMQQDEVEIPDAE